jgi:hypothetical protein
MYKWVLIAHKYSLIPKSLEKYTLLLHFRIFPIFPFHLGEGNFFINNLTINYFEDFLADSSQARNDKMNTSFSGNFGIIFIIKTCLSVL